MDPIQKSRSWTRRRALQAGAALACVTGRVGATPLDDVVALARAAADTGPKRLGLLLPQGSGANLAPIARNFLETTGVHLDLFEVPVDEVAVQLNLDHLTGDTTYDIALPPTFALPDLVENGAIQALNNLPSFATANSTGSGSLFEIGDTFDGQTYGFQTDGDAYVMFYNTSFWSEDERAAYADRHGTALEVPHTWQELDRQMAWFHRPEDGMCGGALFRSPGYVAWEWWVRFHARGVWPLSDTLVPQIATDAGVSALEDMIRATQYLAPETRSAALFENWARYAKGDIYANVGWGGSQKFFNSAGSPLRGKLTYGPTPGGFIGDELLLTPYFNWGWNYVVVANSPRPDLALLFCAFATSASMSTTAVAQSEGFFDPFRVEHYRDPAIIEAYSQDFLAVHRHSMENAIPDLYLARQSDYFLALSRWLNRAIAREVAPLEALQRVEQQWNLIAADVGIARQTRRWQELRAKYPPQSRRLLSDLDV